MAGPAKPEVIDDGLGGELPKPPPPPSTGFGRFTVGLSLIGTLLIIIMTIAVNADIIGRDFFNHPIAGVTEFLGLSIVAVVFLQMANTAARRPAHQQRPDHRRGREAKSARGALVLCAV